MKKLTLVLCVFLVGCGGVTTEWFASFMPLISKPAQRTTPKKGVSLGNASCNALGELGASWYYSGRVCEGTERVVYLDKPHLLEEAIDEMPPDSKYVMFLNECDNPYWPCPPIEEQVATFVALERAWSAANIIWVGPCIAGDAMYLRSFWAEYVTQTGFCPDPATHRLCVHCYNTAFVCIDRVETILDTITFLNQIWVTEFGMVPGWTYSVAEVVDENQGLVDWMENDSRVERYAYWSAKFNYGDSVPAKPVTGWYPLRFDWHYSDGTITEMNTDMGDWYAGVGE